MGVRDSSEAAKLLWKSVRKQNATAALLLSDLYLRGDGVPRSCDQARLLLVAAARRGAPQAAQQLARSGVAGLSVRNPKRSEKQKTLAVARVFCFRCNVSDSALKMIAAQAGLMETENILLPAFQNLRRAPGLAGGGLRTREPTRRGSRAQACRR